MMKPFYIALVGSVSLLVALDGVANAHSTGSAGGQPSVPAGFSSGGNHAGLDSNPTGSTLSSSPRGWDQGKADWKTGSPDGGTSVGSQLSPDSALAPGFTHN